MGQELKSNCIQKMALFIKLNSQVVYLQRFCGIEEERGLFRTATFNRVLFYNSMLTVNNSAALIQLNRYPIPINH